MISNFFEREVCTRTVLPGEVNVVTTGRFDLTIKSNVVKGTRTKQTQDGQNKNPETNPIEGFTQDNDLKMYRVVGQSVVQFYELSLQSAITYNGRYYNIGANNDRGTIKLKRVQ